MFRINYYDIFCLLILACSVKTVWGQCSFDGTTFADSTWHDNTHGDVTFSGSTMSRWIFSSASVLTFPAWTCVNFTSNSVLVLRTSTTVLLSTGSSAYAYVCMTLTTITDYSFKYYLQSLREPELAYERVRISTLTSLTEEEVCDSAVTVPTIEYNVLVKSGFESNAAIQCPDNLLFSADYVYYGSDGSTACDASTDVWNVCTDKSTMIFDYTTCSQQIAFSAGGILWCVANVASTYDYTVVYNNDSTVTGSTTQRFACIASEGTRTYVSITGRNCSVTQTPFIFAKSQQDASDIGQRLVLGTKYEVCASQGGSGGLSAGAIAGIVVSVLYVTYVWTLTLVIVVVILVWILFQFFIILLELTGTFGPRRSPTLSVIEIPEPDKEWKDVHQIVEDVVLTPSAVELKKENKLVKKGNLLPINEDELTWKVNGNKTHNQNFAHENEIRDVKKGLDRPSIHQPLLPLRRKLTPR